jgi:prephenate dehydrogenase
VTTSRRAAVLGTGLIGGSIGLALRERGWHVVGHDRDEDRARRALELGALDMIADGDGPDVDITFVATPVGAVVDAARDALQRTSGLVTDVGSVKRAITEAVTPSTLSSKKASPPSSILRNADTGVSRSARISR